MQPNTEANGVEVNKPYDKKGNAIVCVESDGQSSTTTRTPHSDNKLYYEKKLPRRRRRLYRNYGWLRSLPLLINKKDFN